MSLNKMLPSDVVYGIAYNTSHSGYSPIDPTTAPCYTSSGGCGYDSLNIATSMDPTNVTVGSDPNSLLNPGTVFQYNLSPAGYCDGGTANVFRLDSPTSGCWSVGAPGTLPAYVPAVQFTHQ